MITNYNNYINKKSLNEKLEIDISEKIDDISGMVLHSFDKVKNKIFLENTSDGFEINEEDTYYTIAEFKLSDNKKKIQKINYSLLKNQLMVRFFGLV